MKLARRLCWVVFVAFIGAGVGSVFATLRDMARAFQHDYPALAELVPMPHHVPKYSGGVSLRFAMVHDVLHERFAKHGPDHYRERDRLTRIRLNSLSPNDPARFPLEDDLGVGLDRLGRSNEAIEVMRAKLARQQAQGLAGRDLYTTYANLGTFLIHGNFKAAASGDSAATERLQEGVGLVRKSVEVYPEAHFGREQWQAAIAEFLLAASRNPQLFKTSDCLGNSLELSSEYMLNRDMDWVNTGFGRPYTPTFARGEIDAEVPAFFGPGVDAEDPALWPQLEPIRAQITKVGATSFVATSNRTPAAFDEPMLGIIGMWRQGGGANPHFALAIGETMLRVGQRFIAWSAYERASRLADRFSSDPALQQFLRDHCKRRQADIEQDVAKTNPKILPAQLRLNFEKELAYGEGFQADYQAYESGKIKAGTPIDDLHFFDDFPRRNEKTASMSGSEEWFSRVPNARMADYARENLRGTAVLGAGAAALIMSLIFVWIDDFQKRRRASTVI